MASVDELIAVLNGLDRPATLDGAPTWSAALPHLLQTAERLEADHGDDPELVAAGLVHDLASALELGCPDHAAAGAALVGPLLGPRVAELVAGHTEAKRYLVTVEPDYADGLSANSTFTLVGQGGTMDAARSPPSPAGQSCDALVALRRADDAAKVPSASTRPVDAWRPTGSAASPPPRRFLSARDRYEVAWLTGFTPARSVSSARPWGRNRRPGRSVWSWWSSSRCCSSSTSWTGSTCPMPAKSEPITSFTSLAPSVVSWVTSGRPCTYMPSSSGLAGRRPSRSSTVVVAWLAALPVPLTVKP